MVDWKPVAPTGVLRERARLLATIRRFFAARDVLEVETPVLASGAATDPFIQSLEVGPVDGAHTLYLQTSPEFAMKRLLAAGSGPIWQISKAFRANEAGRHHNPEFTLLEWYRPGFSPAQLMDEVEALLRTVLPLGALPLPRLSYRALFIEHLGFDPHCVGRQELRAATRGRVELASEQDLSETDYLQLLMSACIEPHLPPACFVCDYPVAQAALAVVEKDATGQSVARRFELYCGGMELANGYQELTDAQEQRRRFEQDLARRRELGLTSCPLDERLLAALAHGLPPCSGVALGVDRLLMQCCEVSDIAGVITFPTDRA